MTSDAGNVQSPQFSPDGKWLSYTKQDKLLRSHIWVRELGSAQEHMIGGEAGTDVLKAREAADHESRANEQRRRDGELRDDERRQPAATDRVTSGTLLASSQCGNDVAGSDRVERRQDAEQHAGAKRCGARERQHAEIQAEISEERAEPGPLLQCESMAPHISLGVGQIQLGVRHIKIPAEDHRFFPFQFFILSG